MYAIISQPPMQFSESVRSTTNPSSSSELSFHVSCTFLADAAPCSAKKNIKVKNKCFTSLLSIKVCFSFTHGIGCLLHLSYGMTNRVAYFVSSSDNVVDDRFHSLRWQSVCHNNSWLILAQENFLGVVEDLRRCRVASSFGASFTPV